jgi:four helix bundle protein
MGSASELEYQLLLARELEFLDIAAYELLTLATVEIKRMLTALIQSLTTDD